MGLCVRHCADLKMKFLGPHMIYSYNLNTNESIGITVSQGYRVRLSLKNEMRQNKDGIEIQLYLVMRT